MFANQHFLKTKVVKGKQLIIKIETQNIVLLSYINHYYINKRIELKRIFTRKII